MLKSLAAMALPRELWAQTEASIEVSLKLSDAVPVEVPANFTGLGFEMLSVATPNLLSTENRRYVELVRGLGTRGVLRVGGIVANYTRYVAEGPARFKPQDTVITHHAIERFAAFLEEVGWRAIWSVNFAQGTIAAAIEEARAVHEVLGRRLLALEIGNEVDTYGKGQPFRPATYDYAAYRKEYEEWHAAIRRGVPGVRFAAPDTARTGDWVEQMASDAKGEVQLLTTHYYRNGQRRGSAEQLLKPDPRLEDVLARLRKISQDSGIPWRMCEINSFSGGGLPGVSDTLVGALWTLNTMLILAQYGCAGVNMETGVNQLGFVSSYSPIQDDGSGVNSAGVPYYGMLAFATAFAGCHQLFPLEADEKSESVHAYMFGTGGTPRSVAIVNVDSTMAARVSLAGLKAERATVLRLVAPAADSRTGVRFGGAYERGCSAVASRIAFCSRHGGTLRAFGSWGEAGAKLATAGCMLREKNMRRGVLTLAIACAVSLDAGAQTRGAYESGVDAFNAHRYAEAVTLFAEAEEKAPGATDALLYEGKSLADLNRFKDADAALRKYLDRHSGSADGLYMLGYVLNRENEPAESLRTYTKAAQLSTPKSDDLKVVATDYVLLNDYPDAIKWMRQAIDLDPKNESAWYGLGRCYYSQSSFGNAEQAYRYALKLNPGDLRAQTNLALTLEMLNEPAKAESEYRRSIALADADPHTDQWPYLDYGSFLLEQARGAEAIPLLEKAIALAPQCADCHGKLGRALQAAGKNDAAVKQLEKAVALDPTDAKLHYALGHAYQTANMTDKAKKELAIAARMYAGKDQGVTK